MVHINPATFDTLMALIEDHPVFHNNLNCPQILPHVQLAIFLHHAGHYSNNAGPDVVADWAGLSTGAVDLCSKRVMVVILELHNSVFGPPSEQDRTRSGEYAASVTCNEWDGGKLTGDGTLAVLFQ